MAVKARFVLSTLALLVVVWTLSYFEIQRSQRTQIREAETATLYQAQAFAENTLATIKRLNELLLELRSDWKNGRKNFSEVITGRQAHISDLAFQIGIIDEAGYMAYSNLAPAPNRIYLGDREHFRVHKESTEDRLFISKPLKDKLSGKWTIQFTRPIWLDGVFKGVIVASIAPDFLVAFHQKLHLSDSGISAIAHDSGEIIARYPQTEEHLGKSLTWPAIHAAKQSGNYMRIAQLDGVERVYGYYRLTEHNITILVGESLKSLTTQQAWFLRTILTYAAIISILLIIMAIMIHRWSIIRERSRLQLAELSKQQQLLGMAVAQSTASIVMTDADGNIVFINDAFEKVTGYARHEVMGKNPRFIQSGWHDPAFYQALWGTVTVGKSWRGELQNKKKNGDLFWESTVITPVTDASGVITNFIAVKENITDRKLQEVELRKAKESAEAANIAKSAFLANMSHEIRTPMNGIIGMANILRRQGVTPEQANLLDNIDVASAHLLDVINDILDISKIEANKFVMEDAAIVVGDLIGNVVTIVADRAKAKGIQLRLVSDVLPPNLAGDSARLQQALLNYVANAIKFTEQGMVTISTRLQEDAADSVLVRFEVQDTGVGIPSQVLSRLFSPFEQADNSTTRKHGGSGLGLAITRHLAELMGGEAGVESTLGQGSTFWFTVRLKKREETALAKEAAVPVDAEKALQERHSGKRILVVDDHPMNREIAKILLEGAGLVVDVAENGVEAVRMAEQTPYVAILMDVQMPTMGGLEATRHIRHMPDHGQTPIWAMTANIFIEDRERCRDAGMNGFIGKPFSSAELFANVLESLERGISHRATATLGRTTQ